MRYCSRHLFGIHQIACLLHSHARLILIFLQCRIKKPCDISFSYKPDGSAPPDLPEEAEDSICFDRDIVDCQPWILMPAKTT
jgi:hypothetical protein